MVDDNGKVLKPNRKMDENPERSRKAYEDTKAESIKVDNTQ